MCASLTLFLDWDPLLKPELVQFPYNIPRKSNDTADDSIEPPNKRRQPATSVTPSDESNPAMPPPPTPSPSKKKNNSGVKTPRPDITMGLSHSTVVASLVTRGVPEVKADYFLKALQEEQALCSSPLEGSTTCFPMLVVEGKSYSTGRCVFEAQNQAAVAGSCMMNIQRQLAKLTESVAPGSDQKKEPLAFSLCTEGPHMELWVHYTTSVDGTCKYNMSILQTCHASLPGGVVDFLITIDKVLSWAGSEFLNDVAEQLAAIEGVARQQAT